MLFSLLQVCTILLKNFSLKRNMFRSQCSFEALDINICLSTSINEIFPLVAFNFEGGASIVLKPTNYLMDMGFVVSS